MKSQFSHVVLIAGLTLFGSLSLNAQTKAGATVPFIFQANHYAFSPGDYTLEQAGANTPGRFQLTEKSTGHSIFVTIPIPKDKKNYEEGHLTFACNDGDCVLAQVALPNSNLVYARSDSSIEKDMDRKLGMTAMVNVKLTK
ncbi:MAG TPA: hypothetical protein VH302_01255 [Bryobacteraceae bacterium]|jgi:hypothetical protein|nr:hypothetical protein [Bryobacteraceae bacterium]